MADDFIDPIKLPESALKFRDHHAKRAVESEKQATEYGKLIFTNLIWVNAAGIGTLHVTTQMLGIASLEWSEKYEIIKWPGLFFICGLFSALLGAFAAYLNFGALAELHDQKSVQEWAAIYSAAAETPEEFRQKWAAEAQSAQVKITCLGHRITLLIWASILLGFLSAGAFLFACYQFIKVQAH